MTIAQPFFLCLAFAPRRRPVPKCRISAIYEEDTRAVHYGDKRLRQKDPYGQQGPRLTPEQRAVKTSTPMLNDKTPGCHCVSRRNYTAAHASAETMTVYGRAQKTLFLLVLALSTACFTWSETFAAVQANPPDPTLWAFGGAIVGLIATLALCLKHIWAPALAPVHALAKGLFLGAA